MMTNEGIKQAAEDMRKPRRGFVVSYRTPDRIVPLCIFRAGKDVSCVAVNYSGDHAAEILAHPENLKITNAEGGKFHIEAVATAIAPNVPADSVSICVLEDDK